MTPDRIVQLLYKTLIFAAVVALSTGPWQFYDEQTHSWVRNRRHRLRQFMAWSRNLVFHAKAVPPELTIQQRTKIVPGQA